jgi:threonine/homoserine/homoserine lactone efflux protein
MLNLFLKGLLIGFAIAAPVGPIGVLCIQRSLHNGFKIGLMTGLGAALADGTYGLIAGFGLTAVSSFLISYQSWVKLIGGLFLIYLGIKTFFTPPAADKKTRPDKSSFHAFITTFFLTLTNPATILSFVAVFAGLGLGTIHSDYIHALILVSGIILGSTAWWILLSGGVAFVLHHKVPPSFMRVINWISGLIIFVFGVLAISVR